MLVAIEEVRNSPKGSSIWKEGMFVKWCYMRITCVQSPVQ